MPSPKPRKPASAIQSMPRRVAPTPPAKPRGFATTALVLQGGGALGSYQAGVVEALLERGIEPDWVAGISIGAINAALIAGNAPGERLDKLRGFWESICRPAWPPYGLPPPGAWGGDALRQAVSQFEAGRALVQGQPGFFVPRGAPAWSGLAQPTGQASFYDTAPLKQTLHRFVDFDRLNHGPMRLSVSAVDVSSGNFVYFDNREGPARKALRAEHIMASGALPPGFPAIEIDGHWYWDGGLVSNTPLWQVLEGRRDQDTLVFQVDLWSATGPLPANVWDAQERMKDVQYSSRTRAITDSMKRQGKSAQLLRELLALIPPATRAGNPWCRQAEAQLASGQTTVIQLIYRDKPWEGCAKDFEFSQSTMREHWAAGLADARRALAHDDWLQPDPEGRPFVSRDAAAG